MLAEINVNLSSANSLQFYLFLLHRSLFQFLKDYFLQLGFIKVQNLNLEKNTKNIFFSICINYST